MTRRAGPSWRRVWFVFLWTLAGAGITFGVFWLAVQPRTLFHHDFRGKPTPTSVRLFGPQAGRLIKSEPDGLRITLPKDRKERDSLGVTLSTVVAGDFEITATIEIVHVDEPSPASFGAGVLMTADETARIGRLSRAKGEEVVIWDQWVGDAKKPKLVGGLENSAVSPVRLRMKRTRNTLAYLWAPVGTGEDFQLIQENEFRSDEVKAIKVMAENGVPPTALDVRFLELRIVTDPGIGQAIF